MKLFLKPLQPPYISDRLYGPITRACDLAGIETTFILDDTVDFVYFGNHNSYDYYQSLPEKYSANVPLDFLLKSKMSKMCQDAGINYLQTDIINSVDTITNYPTENVFIKPNMGAMAIAKYSFVYKTYATKAQLLADIAVAEPNFFTVNEDGSSICSDYTIQRAFMPGSTGTTNQCFIIVFVNGQGQMINEGIGQSRMIFNELNDINNVAYPMRKFREYNIKDPHDTADRYNILGQLQQLIDFYSIKNTAINSQWLVDENDQAYLIDLSYNHQTGFYANTNFIPAEHLADRLRFIYDLQLTSDSELPPGWFGMSDFIITSDMAATVEYAISLGMHLIDTWFNGTTGPGSKMRLFSYGYATEQECIDKVNQLRAYIRDNTDPNQLMF